MRALQNSLLPAFMLMLLTSIAQAQPSEPKVALRSSVASSSALRLAQPMGHVDAGQAMQLAVTLPLRNTAQLTDLLRGLYDPKDPQFHHYLTPQQFADKFGPTQASYNAVAAYVRAQGFTVTNTYSSRTLLDIAGTTATVEKAFGIRLSNYRMGDGRTIYANSSAPFLPRSIAAQISGIAGLNSLSLLRRPAIRFSAPQPLIPLAQGEKADLQGNPLAIGSGPAGGLAPADIKVAYSLDKTKMDGTGQSLALYELDGYLPADIAAYVKQFGLATPNLTPKLVDGFNGTPVDKTGQVEVTLDIDLMIALAPMAKDIYVYEGKNGTIAQIDIYTQIATDDLASEVSSSWGDAEMNVDGTTRDAENTAFQQMAAQGQSFFCAAGDFGAYTDYNPAFPSLGATLSVDDPASQPFATGVGGTRLTLASIGGPYVSESTWNTSALDSANGPEGGGGGVSQVWPKPAYQAGFGSSATTRDVPDVSLDADPETGYDIFVAAQNSTSFFKVGGTSAASPLWAAFTALVNQQRTANGLTTPIGFVNPTLYTLSKTSSYAADFHDIADRSTNLYYVAVPGYDDATGLGTFIGGALLADLSGNSDEGGAPGTVTGSVLTANSTPLQGATVTATSTATGAIKATTTTDSSGAFTLTVPSSLTLTITAQAPNLAGQAESIPSFGPNALAAGGKIALPPFVLNPAHSFPAGLQMISSPDDYTNVGDFASIFGLTTPLKNTDPRLISWQASQNSYISYPDPPADTLHRGMGYWVKFPAATYLRRSGEASNPTQSFSIPLQTGWNQISDPFSGASPLSGITVQPKAGGSGALLPVSPLISPVLYLYDPASNAYIAVNASSDSLMPYAGYWIYASSAAVLVVTPSGAPPPPGGLPLG